MSPRVLVLGEGPVGRAVRDRLRQAGNDVRSADRATSEAELAGGADVVLMALTHGAESLAVLESGVLATGTVVDLTTQAPASASTCASAAGARGIAYHGGGVTGGAGQLSSGTAVLLLGPAPDPALRALLSPLGRIHPIADPAAAAAAKLLHNFVLLVSQWAVATAIRAAEQLDVEGFADVLASGTAGRPVAASSILRDARGTPVSTYSTRLARKDLVAMRDGLPGLDRAAGAVLDVVLDALSPHDEMPFTQSLLAARAVDGVS